MAGGGLIVFIKDSVSDHVLNFTAYVVFNRIIIRFFVCRVFKKLVVFKHFLQYLAVCLLWKVDLHLAFWAKRDYLV
jgi:hypothetical protein